MTAARYECSGRAEALCMRDPGHGSVGRHVDDAFHLRVNGTVVFVAAGLVEDMGEAALSHEIAHEARILGDDIVLVLSLEHPAHRFALGNLDLGYVVGVDAPIVVNS